MTPLRLDWDGDAQVPANARLVETEVQWLQVAPALRAPDAENVWVRGAALCRWAEQWWQGAGGQCERVRNALDGLCDLAPRLSRDEAKEIVAALEKCGCNSVGLSLSEITAALFPDYGDAGAGWLRVATSGNRLEIAAHWLLWLENHGEFEASRAKLIAQQCEIWREANGEWDDLFPATSDAACDALRAWLGLQFDRKFAARPPFPVALPPRWLDEARNHYARVYTLDFADEGAPLEFWRRFERGNAPLALRKIAAETLADWLSAHPQQISAGLVALLEPLLRAETLSSLRALQPPRAPNALPEVKGSSAHLIFEWATQEYLPFRAWQCGHGNDDAREKSVTAAMRFGVWFAHFYEGAMVGAARKWLQIHRANELRSENTGEITFWVIADGLGWLDARVLSQTIGELEPRLTLLEMAPYFATIPTITSFAKPSLRWSAPPDAVAAAKENANDHRREIEVAGHKEAAGALRNAQSGDLIIWTPLEPDATYHENAAARILRSRVAGTLEGLARQIVEAAHHAPAEIPLQIVITTDHGRMLGESGRAHQTPLGFSSHGRAAYGDFKPDEMPEGVMWLDPELYKCGSHVAIALDEGALTTNASDVATPRGGVEKFAHGGIFPEEVVVPWLVFGRDVAPLHVEAMLTGKARAGRASAATLRLSNMSNRALTLETLELKLGNQTRTIALEPKVIERFGNAQIEIEISVWPAKTEIQSARGTLWLRAPDGRLAPCEVKVELETEELQTRENVLEDLF